MAVSNGNHNERVEQSQFLIWGGNGWIAGHLKNLLERQGKHVNTTTIRMEDRDDVVAELIRIKPTHVLNAAGCTLTLADVCFQYGIHITIFATGCVYQYDQLHPIGGAGYTEEEAPNFDGSFYSLTKGHIEPILKSYPNSLVLRLRMPVSDDLHPRNFVAKLLNYDRVVDIPNSNTILHDLLPAAVILAEHGEIGVYNFTNPGAISHNEVLSLFKDIVRPRLSWENFSLEDQAKVIKAGRSNCTLDTSKLVSKLKEYGYRIHEIHDAYKRCFERMKANGVQ